LAALLRDARAIMTDLYLASQSPRRRELLRQIGVRYTIVDVSVLEVRAINELPLDYVQRLACAKALAGALLFNDKPVLGADTIVVLPQGDVLEKPKNKKHAIAMLMSLSDKQHQVMTAVSICHQQRCETRVNTSIVEFRPIDEPTALRYWQTGEPADKAGAYGIQGLGGVFVRQIIGSYSSVVGLPLLETTELLTQFNVDYWQ
jgi:septum formation protein